MLGIQSMFYRTFGIDEDGLEKHGTWKSPISDLNNAMKKVFPTITFTTKSSLKSLLLTITLIDHNTLVQLGIIYHIRTISSMNDSVDNSDKEIRQIIDTSSCLRTSGASFILLFQVNKYKNKNNYDSNNDQRLMESILSLEKQTRGCIDMIIIQDSCIKNEQYINYELHKYQVVSSLSSSTTTLSSSTSISSSSSIMTPIIVAVHDKLSVINLKRNNHGIHSVETNVI